MRQQSIPGTEPDHPEVADAIERWLDACERAKRAAEEKAEADDLVVIKMLELGVQHYPYTDAETGKRKWRVVDTTPRGKSLSARPAPQEALEADEPSESESTPKEAGADDEVTHRRVSRKRAAKEIAEREADVRARDAQDDPMTQGAAAVDGALRPARSWDDDEADERPSVASARKAVDRLHAFADSMPGTTVTISSGGKTATLGKRGKAK